MKKFICTALAMILAVGLMTGCRRGAQNDTTGGTGEGTQGTSPSLPATTPTEASMPEVTIPDMTDILPDGGASGEGGTSGNGGIGEGGMDGQGNVGRGRGLMRY